MEFMCRLVSSLVLISSGILCGVELGLGGGSYAENCPAGGARAVGHQWLVLRYRGCRVVEVRLDGDA